MRSNDSTRELSCHDAVTTTATPSTSHNGAPLNDGALWTLVAPMVQHLAAKRGLDPDEADDFRSFVHEKLVTAEVRVINGFHGRSSLRTYLAVVISRLFLDFRNATWGKWRPSAFARRAGPHCVRLERLIVRDGWPLREAIQYLQQCDPGVSERLLYALARQLPHRVDRRGVSLDLLDHADLAPVWGIDATCAEAAHESDSMRSCLRELIEALPAEDQLIVRMRYWDGTPLVAIARALNVDQFTLYRRCARLRVEFRDALARRGFPAERVLDIMQEERVS